MTRPIMSRFMAVQRMGSSVVLAGQVGYPVRLVASSLVGSARWNDCENDQAATLQGS